MPLRLVAVAPGTSIVVKENETAARMGIVISVTEASNPKLKVSQNGRISHSPPETNGLSV